MYGSGVRTGMAVIAVLLKPILLVHRVVFTAFIAAAAVGSSMLGAAAHPIATAMSQATAATFSGCASPSPSNKSWASALSTSKLSGYELMASGQEKRRAEPPLIKTTRHQRI